MNSTPPIPLERLLIWNIMNSTPPCSPASSNSPPIPLRRLPTMVSDEKTDDRIDHLQTRFPWMSTDFQWKPNIRKPPTHTYHLRAKKKIKCTGCLHGNLDQQSHMDPPYGCLSTSSEEKEYF